MSQLLRTHIPVELILESLSAGELVDNLLKSYPRLTKEAISAALAFAAEALNHLVGLVPFSYRDGSATGTMSIV